MSFGLIELILLDMLLQLWTDPHCIGVSVCLLHESSCVAQYMCVLLYCLSYRGTWAIILIELHANLLMIQSKETPCLVTQSCVHGQQWPVCCSSPVCTDEGMHSLSLSVCLSLSLSHVFCHQLLLTNVSQCLI